MARNGSDEAGGQFSPSFWKRHEGEILFSFLAVYVAILALGTAGVLLDIGWIVNLPIF